MIKKVSLNKELSLTTDGRLRLVFLGTGSAFSKRFYQSNLLIAKADKHLLVDCGTRCPEALAAYGLGVDKIEHYIFTHSHADHIGGVEEIVLVNRYFARKRPHLYMTKKYQKLFWNESIKGGAAYSEKKGWRRYLTLDDFFIVHEPAVFARRPRHMYVFNVGDIEVILFRTRHIPEQARSWRDSAWSTGLLIDRRVLFTGDTQFDPKILEYFVSNFPVETIFHDCQFFTGGVHTSLDELSSLPKHIKKMMYLVHYGDAVDKYRDRVKDEGFAGFAEENTAYYFE